jgi:transposase
MIYIGLPDYEVKEVNDKRSRTLIKVATKLVPKCPRCASQRLHSKGPYERGVRHLPSMGQAVEVVVCTRRYRCRDCNRHFVPSLPGIRPWHRLSEPYREQIYQDHHDGICASRVAEREKISPPTVSRTYAAFTARKAKERQRLECPPMLGIDEHTLHRNGTFVTTFADLRRHKVFDVAEGRSARELAGFLRRLKGRHKVRVICIDLSNPYRDLIRKWFPNAILVADRFHAVRIVMHHFTELAKELAQLKYKRGYLCVLRKRPENLTEKQKQLLEELFQRHPVLRPFYEKMREICDLFNKKTQKARQCRQHAKALFQHIADLKAYSFPQLHTLAKTLTSWAEPIAAMWRFRKNNSITEGFHRKMKLIQRRAYGFRNFNNYRLRVIAQCG